ncbi:MAG: dienelactone hydrolase family protein [Candidatus Binatia bacterium]
MVTRREFLQHGVLATSGLAAGKLFVDAFTPMVSHAAQVEPNDPGLTSSEIKYASTDGTAISAYITRPKGNEAHPAVLVIHEWDGIKEQIRDVARRLARAGYVALAPDLLSRYGGTSSFPTSEEAIAAGRKLDDDMITKDLTGGVKYLKGQNFVRANRVGVIGFCWGGGKALLFTTRSKDLAASVIYYGSNPSNLEDVKNISAPVLGQYGGADERITSAVPKLDDAMKKYGKSFEYKVYPGAPHAFNSDGSPSYREEAAKEAWGRTLEFFKIHLQS